MLLLVSEREDRRSPAKNRAILDAAVRAFLEHGYARTSVDAIAAEAGVGKQTVYSHFGDKNKLFLAAVEDARQQAGGVPPIADTGDPAADLAKTVERVLDITLSERLAALHRLSIAELRHHPELQRMWRDLKRTRTEPQYEDRVAEYLRDRDKAGTLRVPDPELAARQLLYLAITEGRVVTLQGTERLKPADRRRIARESVDLIVRAHRA